jgi:hypothetical protein
MKDRRIVLHQSMVDSLDRLADDCRAGGGGGQLREAGQLASRRDRHRRRLTAVDAMSPRDLQRSGAATDSAICRACEHQEVSQDTQPDGAARVAPNAGSVG